jgi:hypothetical protein
MELPAATSIVKRITDSLWPIWSPFQKLNGKMQVPPSERLVFTPNSLSFFSRDFLEILMLF